MRTNLSRVLCRVLLACLLCSQPLFGQNDALHFDGCDDYISLNPIANFAPGSDFTAEMWFRCTSTGGNGTCNGDFRRLFSFGGPNNSRFEVGECNGILSAYLTGYGIVQSSINVRDNQWHCIAAVRSGNTFDVLMDGSLVPNLTSLAAGTFSATLFRVGHWPGGTSTCGQDWWGFVDEVKLWGLARSPAQLATCATCVQPRYDPNLVVYWRFDEITMPGGSNTNQSTVLDYGPVGNNGNLYKTAPNGFALNGPTSNFVASTAPILYPHYDDHHVFLSDALQTIGLASICKGDPVHFAIVDASGTPTQAAAGTSVVWEYSDDCLNWTPMPLSPAGPPSALFSGFSFVSPPGHPATDMVNCAPNAFVDRCYRAIITVTNGVSTCTYTAQSLPLRICCPIQNAVLNINPAGPLCEGDVVQFGVSLSSNMPQPNPFNNVHISWCVIIGNGPAIPLTGPGYTDQSVIAYGPITLGQQNICFKATISNCACAPVTVQKCVQVDLQPICGTITGAPSPANLMPDPDLDPNHYVICPDNDAAVQIATPFTNCIPLWQYMYPNTQPGVWHDMGSSNSVQNTNILPHLKPPVAPYMWPAGETCIRYRIKCLPLTYPNSGCPPCYSNELRVCLKTPQAPVVVAAAQNPICKASFSMLSIQNPQAGVSYEWFCNGLSVGFGNTLNATSAACYWVVGNDGCFAVASNRVCLNVCETVAIISCPAPICPCIGDQITLSALDSYSTCGNPLTYTWTVNGQTYTGPILTDVPAVNGTSYTLTVTDNLGCSDTVTTTVTPCPN